MSKSAEFEARFADTIIEMLEAGTAPWCKPWAAGELARMPFNAATGKEYRNGNLIWLHIIGMARGFDDPRWMTYKQAEAAGYQVRKGAKSEEVVFFSRLKPKAGEEIDDDGKPRKARLVLKTYRVFNAAEIDGIPALPGAPENQWDSLQIGETILSASGARIGHDGGDRAYYSPVEDAIHLPRKEAFADASGYYDTALHELGHWTGHEERLHRDLSGSFGSESYAKEELRAEIASWMLAAVTGLPFDPRNHASYVHSWVKIIKEDRKEIVRACRDAQKIVDYLLDMAGITADTEATADGIAA